MKAKIVSLNTWTESDQAGLYSALKQGRVIAYPTDTIYGLGVDVFHPGAVETLLLMKGREGEKAISVLYPGVERMLRDFNYLNDFQMQAVYALLPGRVTLLLPVISRKQFPASFMRAGYVGVRVVDLPALNTLLKDYPHPVSTTSVNPAARPPAQSVEKIQRYFPCEISWIIDNGTPENTISSTIIKLSTDNWEIIRKGAVSAENVEKILNQLI